MRTTKRAIRKEQNSNLYVLISFFNLSNTYFSAPIPKHSEVHSDLSKFVILGDQVL